MNTQATEQRAKHTAGPWRVVKRANQRGIRSLTIDTGHLSGGTYCKMGSSELSDEDEANARLIAAAPELLGALQAVLEAEANPQPWITPKFSDAIALARSALAKVKGEQ